MRQPVFDIVEVEPESYNSWLVRGRAIEELELHDLVRVKTASLNGTQPFKIVAIETYGLKTPILSKMWTGTLTLQGVSGQSLKPGQILSRKVIQNIPSQMSITQIAPVTAIPA